jgi:hypothetical protein
MGWISTWAGRGLSGALTNRGRCWPLGKGNTGTYTRLPLPKNKERPSHTTGKFRGWLCTGCNTALGMANDDPRILRSLADYIERWQESYKEPGASLIQPSFL